MYKNLMRKTTIKNTITKYGRIFIILGLRDTFFYKHQKSQYKQS